MCQVNVRSCGGSGGGAVVGLALAGGAVALVVSVIGSVVTAVAALLSTLLWALAVVGGVGVLAAAGVAVTREVLAYRADRREQQVLLARLAARGIPVPPSAQSAVRGPGGWPAGARDSQAGCAVSTAPEWETFMPLGVDAQLNEHTLISHRLYPGEDRVTVTVQGSELRAGHAVPAAHRVAAAAGHPDRGGRGTDRRAGRALASGGNSGRIGAGPAHVPAVSPPPPIIETR